MTQPHAATSRLDDFAAHPRRALWKLSIPIMVGMSIQTIYMMVDMIFVGRVGASALTALAFNLPLVFLAMGTAFGLGSGVTALVAQAVGARDKDQADRVAEHSVLLAVVTAAVFTTVALVFGRPLLATLGVPADLLPTAWGYFRVLASGFAFMVTSIFLRSILTGEGEVKIPVMIQMGGTALNIGLDPLFIFTFGLGVEGAALATVISQALVAVALAYLLFVRKHSYVDFAFGSFRLRPAILAGIFRIGIPASLSFLVMSLAGSLFNRILVEYSTDAVAAFQVGGRLDHVVVLPLVALASSLVTLVGMFYGAGRRDLLREVVRYSLACAISIGSVMAVLFFVFAPWIVAIFSDNDGIRELAVSYLRTVAFAYPFFGVSMLTGRALQGLGRGTPDLVLTLLRVVLIAVPLTLFFTFVLHKPVGWVWIAMVIASWTSALVASVWLKVGIDAAATAVLPELGDDALPAVVVGQEGVPG